MSLKRKVFYLSAFVIGVGIGGAANVVGHYEQPTRAYTPRIVIFEPEYIPEPYQTFDATEFIPYPDPTLAPTPEPTKKPKPKPKPASKPVVVRYPFAPTVKEAQKYALSRVGRYQYNCLYLLWQRESGWRTHAENKRSGAYGIPQALPGKKMAKFGDDWRDNPITQVKWGIFYIKGRYGTSCRALQHSYNTGWY